MFDIIIVILLYIWASGVASNMFVRWYCHIKGGDIVFENQFKIAIMFWVAVAFYAYAVGKGSQSMSNLVYNPVIVLAFVILISLTAINYSCSIKV